MIIYIHIFLTRFSGYQPIHTDCGWHSSKWLTKFHSKYHRTSRVKPCVKLYSALTNLLHPILVSLFARLLQDLIEEASSNQYVAKYLIFSLNLHDDIVIFHLCNYSMGLSWRCRCPGVCHRQQSICICRTDSRIHFGMTYIRSTHGSCGIQLDPYLILSQINIHIFRYVHISSLEMVVHVLY